MFWLYHRDQQPDGVSIYRRGRAVKLAGGGLIQSACRDLLGNEVTPWTLSSRELLIADGHDPETHELVIDIAPSRPTVSLYEVRSLSGFSYRDWTPLMFTFEMLFGDAKPSSSLTEMKRQFDDRDCPRAVVREFLYLRGGYVSGNWNWGGNNFTTAVLLFEDAWSYFQQQSTAAIRG
jgi:hypothetical protein